MKWRVIFCLSMLTLLLAFGCFLATFAETRTFSTISPLPNNYYSPYNNYYNTNQLQKINYSRLTQIERAVLGRSYGSQNLQSRLNRLESKVFNTTYPAMALNQRIDNLMMNYNQMNNWSNNYSCTPANKNWQGVVSRIFSQGTMTGFTPPITSSSYYDSDFFPYYSNGLNQSVQTNHGYYNQFQNNGASTGVTILN